MQPRHQNWFEGWRLAGALTLVLAGLCIWIAAMRQFEVEGVRMVIRFTARSSLLFFCLPSPHPLWRDFGLPRERAGCGATGAISESPSRPRTAFTPSPSPASP
jgi:hypothetical protein